MVWQRAAEATRRIDRRSDSKALTGNAAGKAKRGVETHKQCIMWIRKSQGSKDERWHGIEKIRLELLRRREETICDGEELHKLCIVRQY